MHNHDVCRICSSCQQEDIICSLEGDLKVEGFEMMSVEVEDFGMW